MSITLTALQKQRRDTAANWTTANPTLLAGEIGIESDTGYWKVGDGSTAWTSLAYLSGLGGEIPVSRLADGAARQLLQTAANGTDVEWTSNVDVPGTLDVTGVATFDNNVTVQGDLTVNGTTTTIDTTNLVVEDKNIEIGKVATPTDVTADGGGITLKGSTDKTINWVDATDAWTFSEHVNIASAKEYRIAGTKVLDATSLGSAVVSSSLTSVGTITSGTWQGTAIAGTKVSPDFGSQNVTTTGTSTAASLIPTSSSAPTNGVYLPATNTVGVATNGAGRLFVDSTGRVGVNTSSPTTIASRVIHVAAGAGESSALRLTGNAGTGLDFIQALNGDGFIYQRDNSPLIFGTNNLERLRITSAGLVGIGTTPGAILDVAPDANRNFQVQGKSGTTYGLEIKNGTANSGGEFHVTAASSGGVVFNRGITEMGRFDSSSRFLVGTSSSLEASSFLQVYQASGNNFARLQSGSLGTNEQATLLVKGGTREGAIGVFKHSGITNPCSFLGLMREDATDALYWTDNSGNLRVSTSAANIGTTSGTVVGTQTSDARLKNILGPVEYGLDTLKQIEPVRYALKSEPDAEKLGFIAQQVQPLIPQSVFDTNEHIEGEPEDAPTKLGMEYVALIPVLVNAIKELSAEVDALKAQLL